MCGCWTGDLDESIHFRLFFIKFVCKFGSFPNGISHAKLFSTGSNSMLLLQRSSHVYHIQITSYIKLINLNYFTSKLILIKINFNKTNSINAKPNTHLVTTLSSIFLFTVFTFGICEYKCYFSFFHHSLLQHMQTM